MIKVENISIVEARLYHYYITDCQNPDNTERFEYIVDKFDSEINIQDSEVRFRWHIRINAHQKVKKAKHDVFLDAYSQVDFHIKELKENIKFTEEGLPMMEQTELYMLAGIAFSTIRGLIAGTAKGTLFHEAYLPIYTPAKLVNG